MGVVGKDILEFLKFTKSNPIAEFYDGIVTDPDFFAKEEIDRKGI